MNENFNLQEYITTGVERFVANTLKATLKNPRETAFMLKFAAASKKASAYRKKREAAGFHIPAFLIASITNRCNLHCEGCYSRDTHATSDEASGTLLSAGDWADIFRQATELGVSFIVLAGGEPLLRRDVIEAAANVKSILFPVFTNGTFLTEDYKELFNKNRNLLPVLSMEGLRDTTDKRRGKGIYNMVTRNMSDLQKKNIAFGISVTVTTENIAEVLSDDFVNDAAARGAVFIFYVEYVPIDDNNGDIAPGEKEREFLTKRVEALRESVKNVVFVSIPGDEQAAGGCLAAGRGFFHINAKGDAESCPMSPFSDVNVKSTSLEEALRSTLFARLKESGLLSDHHRGGCALAAQKEAVKKMME